MAGEFGRMTLRAYVRPEWRRLHDLGPGRRPEQERQADRHGHGRSSELGPLGRHSQGAGDGPVAGQAGAAPSGAVRIHVTGDTTALMIDGSLELPVGKGNRNADLWLEARHARPDHLRRGRPEHQYPRSDLGPRRRQHHTGAAAADVQGRRLRPEAARGEAGSGPSGAEGHGQGRRLGVPVRPGGRALCPPGDP